MPPLEIEISDRVRSEVRSLPEVQLDQLDAALRLLPQAFGRPHVHCGLGIRRLKRHYFEFRVGRDFRGVFSVQGSKAVLRMIGGHDAVRAYIRQL